MEVASLLMPLAANQMYIADLISRSKKPARKTNDFYIIHQTRGVDGATLPDAGFAEDLEVMLEEEKLVSGKRAVVGRADETAENMKEVFEQMSASVVILVILSEAALQTFAGQLREQNNYLLLIQFALKLHDACGVRILGLNLVAVDESDPGVRALIKFQGWMVKFSEDPHPSPWIQDSIAKSMRRLFAIQGINVDLEDWEFKIPTLFASFYAAQDDLNATGWQSVLKIIPWKSISGLLATFSYCFLLPGIGFLICMTYLRCSGRSSRHKEAYFNTGLFATGLSLIFLAAVLMGYTVHELAQGALCSSSVKCEVMVRAGARWSLWRPHAIECALNWPHVCYDINTNGTNRYSWSQDFSSFCATCVCESLRRVADDDPFDTKTCSKNGESILSFFTILLFLLALACLCVALSRLYRQALLSSKQVKMSRRMRRSAAIMIVV